MPRYTITETTTKELIVDLEDLIDEFGYEWGHSLAQDWSTEDFIEELVEEFGIDGIEESFVDGPFSLVHRELSIENDQ